MTKWKIFIAVLAVTAGIQAGRFVRAGEPARTPTYRHCSEGIARFGKLSCGDSAAGGPVIQAYFYGATSLDEVARTYPARLEKLKASCRKKIDAPAAVQFQVETIDVCNGKRGYQEPCVRNEDCLENVCHSVRGTCSTVFTVPNPFGP
jgi:hypothetical protein